MNMRTSIPINDRLKDIDGNLIEEDGVHGEMYIKGPCMMSGYLDNPTATAAAIDKDGWLRTGDIAYTIKGKVYIIDRAKVCHCPMNVYAQYCSQHSSVPSMSSKMASP